jgi:uncharacterized protein YjbI with pentapeptide repeats
MRKWDAPDNLALLHRIMTTLREQRVLEPESFGLADPLDLQGLSFPTVELCKQIGMATTIVSSVTGRQEFCEASLRRIDFSKARLDFSVWNNCTFEHLRFDNAKLQNVRFFGCRFVDCSFRSTSFRDASFSVGRNGGETEIIRTVFEKADFQGTSCHSPVLRSTSFLNCKLDGFVFDSALFDNVHIAGEYDELTFRGMPGEPDRNRLHVDFSKASVTWLNADFGVDLTAMTLPADGSCIVIKERQRGIAVLNARLAEEAGDTGKEVARLLMAIYSDRSMSPMEPSQTTFALTHGQIKSLLETDDEAVTKSVFERIRSIAEQEGFLAVKK